MNEIATILMKPGCGGRGCDCVLTAGCDTQDDRIVCTVYGCRQHQEAMNEAQANLTGANVKALTAGIDIATGRFEMEIIDWASPLQKQTGGGGLKKNGSLLATFYCTGIARRVVFLAKFF